MNKRKFTKNNVINGESAVRRLSQKAQGFYFKTDPFTVYEYADCTGKEGRLYAYDGALGYADGMTISELEEALEDFADAVLGDYKGIDKKTCTCAAAHIQVWPDLVHYQDLDKVPAPCERCPYVTECVTDNFPYVKILNPIIKNGEFNFSVGYSE